MYWHGLPRWLSGGESASQCRRCGRNSFGPWAGKVPWRKKWQPTPVFSPGKSHEWRSLVGYSSQGHKESDTAEQLSAQYMLIDINIVIAKLIVHMSAWIWKKLKTVPGSEVPAQKQPTWEGTESELLMSGSGPAQGREARLSGLVWPGSCLGLGKLMTLSRA